MLHFQCDSIVIFFIQVINTITIKGGYILKKNNNKQTKVFITETLLVLGEGWSSCYSIARLSCSTADCKASNVSVGEQNAE